MSIKQKFWIWIHDRADALRYYASHKAYPPQPSALVPPYSYTVTFVNKEGDVVTSSYP